MRRPSAIAARARANVTAGLDLYESGEFVLAARRFHLASTQAGHTEFVYGALGELLLGRAQLPEKDDRPVVFSPFGLGVLDLAVADLVLGALLKSGGGMRVPSFLP